MYTRIRATIFFMIAILILGACSNNAEEAQEIENIEAVPTPLPTSTPDAGGDFEEVASTQVVEVALTEEPTIMSDLPSFLLPERSGLRQRTSGRVPHVQIGINPDAAVNDELFRRAYLLPGVEDRPTTVSLPGGRGMWLADEVPVINPGTILSGREFAHIHTDGSLHAPLPVDRALEVAEKGWGEMHPWSGEREGFDGFVMLYTPLTIEELDVTFQLIVESYNHVTGEMVQAADFQ